MLSMCTPARSTTVGLLLLLCALSGSLSGCAGAEDPVIPQTRTFAERIPDTSSSDDSTDPPSEPAVCEQFVPEPETDSEESSTDVSAEPTEAGPIVAKAALLSQPAAPEMPPSEPVEPEPLASEPSAPEPAISADDEQLELLSRMISAEASRQPYEGMVAVGAVIVNRLNHPDFPDDIEAVIFEPGQFTPAANGWFWQTEVTEEHRKAARDALSGVDPSGGALYFFAPAKTTNAWLWSRPLKVTIGDHRFTA